MTNVCGARVDQRMGNGVWIRFIDQIAWEDPAGDAVSLTIAIRDQEEPRNGWERLGYRLRFRNGV